MRVVTYARYSSDNQRETSIEDQFRLNDARAVREGWPKAERFSDAEVSAGTPTLLRPGGKSLMEAIRTGQVDVLLIEALDRCWRDIVDQERTIREMERRGVRIVGVSDGALRSPPRRSRENNSCVSRRNPVTAHFVAIRNQTVRLAACGGTKQRPIAIG